MIKKDCFAPAWIDAVSDKYNYRDKNLIEKVIRAFSLLEMLSSNGCPMVWKGGSSLMVILDSRAFRLSIDIDVICPPGTDIADYLKGFEQFGFSDCSMIERQQRTGVPKSHSKLHYMMAYRTAGHYEGSILLDVLYEDSQYHQTDEKDILIPLFEVEGTPLKVRVPSVNDILGDKLTAFAPNTCGIPYYKSGRSRSLDIIKQLFDISRLMDAATDFSIVREVFGRIAPIELAYRGQDPDIAPVFEDIRQTAICISTRGLDGEGQFNLLQTGITSMQSFAINSRYVIEDTIVDAAKAALLATMIEKGVNDFVPYEQGKEGLGEMTVSASLPPRLAKLRRNNPEAFYYWAKTGELL